MLYLHRPDVQMKTAIRCMKFQLVLNRRHVLALKLFLLLLLEFAKLQMFCSFEMENGLVF